MLHFWMETPTELVCGSSLPLVLTTDNSASKRTRITGRERSPAVAQTSLKNRTRQLDYRAGGICSDGCLRPSNPPLHVFRYRLDRLLV